MARWESAASGVALCFRAGAGWPCMGVILGSHDFQPTEGSMRAIRKTFLGLVATLGFVAPAWIVAAAESAVTSSKTSVANGAVVDLCFVCDPSVDTDPYHTEPTEWTSIWSNCIKLDFQNIVQARVTASALATTMMRTL